MAKGDYVLFLNAADKFAKKDTLKEINELLIDECDILYGKCRTTSGSRKNLVFGGKLTFFNIALDHYVAHQSVFARRELLLKYPFDLNYKYQADQDFMFRAKMGGVKMKYVNKIIALYDGNGVSSQPNSIISYRHERCRALKKYHPFIYVCRELVYFLKYKTIY